MIPGFNLANQLTLSRLALGPLFLIAYLGNFEYSIELALIVSVLIEATDVADGIAARSKKQVSDVGKLLDPMSDTIARISYFIGFLVLGYAAAWMVAILVYRDVVVAYLRVFSALTGTAMGRRTTGKWKGILQGAVALTILVLQWIDTRFMSIPHFERIVYWILAGVTVYTFFTLIEYLHGNRELLKEIRHRGRPV
ncbi:MAG: CDP-alcohol phosphatidyltransferase family protein [Calditrichaeota bacterium]|nr:CDP-alcohol phosphatidyltransferase family protein [Calditrichota bacterium]MCB9367988.1 CDP-alcohol phosphatidyltransferase family protein [Calditrichota bacterium]